MEIQISQRLDGVYQDVRLERPFYRVYTLYAVSQALYSATFGPKHPHFCRSDVYSIYIFYTVSHHLQPICDRVGEASPSPRKTNRDMMLGGQAAS